MVGRRLRFHDRASRQVRAKSAALTLILAKYRTSVFSGVWYQPDWDVYCAPKRFW
jgi:hypothetical protein